MPRKRSRDGDEDPEASQPPASQAASQATQAPPLEAAELEKLSATAVRFVLMREHSRKPLARTELKEAVLREVLGGDSESPWRQDVEHVLQRFVDHLHIVEVCMYVCVCVCVCVRARACVCVHVYTHTHTRTHA